MSARILLVEDEPSIVTGLRDVLAVKGYAVDVATRGDEALRAATAQVYDLLLLDVMLPGLSGLDVLRQLRQAGSRTRVIMLTARNTEMDKVLGFELGVDDYVTKPFSLLELLGRIGAVLRRGETAPASDTLTVGDVTIDLKRYRATRDGNPLDLPARAIDILRVLLARRGEAVSRDALIDAVWGADQSVNQRTVTNLVLRIRTAIEKDPDDPQYLKTVHGIGYRLDI